MRVCLVSLQGNGKFEITQTKYRLTEEQKMGDGEALFDFCAECLQTFINTNMSDVKDIGDDSAEGTSSGNEEGLLKPGQELPLGFTVCHNFCPTENILTHVSLVLISLRVRTPVLENISS